MIKIFQINKKKRLKRQIKNYKLFTQRIFVNENLKSFNKANELIENLLKKILIEMIL